MNKLEQLIKYDFHDSLLERISYDKENSKVFLEIDFCNWKQKWYSESEEETSIILLVFENVSNVIIPVFKLNSDEIIDFVVSEDNSVKIVIFNDIDENSYEIIINAETVKIIK